MNDKELAIINLNDVSVFSARGSLITGINWTMKAGEVWAITGSNGSGKTLLAEILAGKKMPRRGEVNFNFPSLPQVQRESNLPAHERDAISLVSFDASVLFKPFRDMYYQKRFNAAEDEDMPLTAEFLKSQAARFNAGPYLEKLIAEMSAFFPEYILNRKLNQLSNGETKKLLILLALIKQPYLLILDQPFTGLDPENRMLLLNFIQELRRQQMQLILICRPDEIPAAADKVLQIINGSVISHSQEEFQSTQKALRTEETLIPGLDSDQSLTIKRSLAFRDADFETRMERLLPFHGVSFEKAVSMRNISVSYGSNHILQNINWEIKSGEKWVLSGPNGSGKSTLLSLINGDHPQAYSMDLSLFDRKRGTGESIWDIKQKIGFMSPELQVYFPREQSAFRILLSGMNDTLGLFRKAKPEEEAKAEFLLEMMEIKELKDLPFRNLSTGEQRLVLLGRALIKNPPLLILDEPCQGLDLEHRDHFIRLVDEICTHGQHTLIYVSHYREEIPECAEYEFKLPEGISSSLNK